MSNLEDRLPRPLAHQARREVEIYGALFTDTAMRIASEGVSVKALEHELLDDVLS